MTIYYQEMMNRYFIILLFYHYQTIHNTHIIQDINMFAPITYLHGNHQNGSNYSVVLYTFL